MGEETSMSLDLPQLPSRYPDQWPTYDLSSLLINGVQPFAPGSALVTVEPNHVTWDLRLNTSQLVEVENRRFLENIPAELMPTVSTTRIALHGAVAAQVQWNSAYRFMQIYAVRLDTYGSLSFEGRTLRRPA